MKSQNNVIEEAQKEYEGFIDKFRSLQLATVDKEGNPNASYAPFAVDPNKNFYIFISGLSQHTSNLYHTALASVMFIEDEKTAKQLFARKRLTYQCEASFIEESGPDWPLAKQTFEERFGETFRMLKTMSDFRMFKLVPSKGLFVIGFGQAFSVSGSDLIQLSHIGAPGGKSKSNEASAHGARREL